MTARTLVLPAVTVCLLLLTGHEARGQFGQGGGFGGGFGRQELRIVPQFDKDADGRLNAVERRAARSFLESQPSNRRGGRSGAQSSAVRNRALTRADVKPPYPTTPLYDMATLRTIFLQFENADWEQELATFYNTDVEVPATVVIDGKTYADVGVHFRGNSSYRQVPAGYKRSLNLAFDDVHDTQEVGGYTTMNLLNSHEDPTYLHTVLSQEIARDYLAAPKSNFVRVAINGENWGIYVSSEQFNRIFVKEWFGTRMGARWKVPGNPRSRAGLEYWDENVAQYKRVYEIKSKDDPKAWADLVRLTRVLNETPADALEAALTPMLDIDGTLRFLALDIALNNGDGYWTRASDYVIYQDVKGRFHILPGDMNETFSEGGRGFGFGGVPPSATLDPLVGLTDTSKPLRSKLLAVPSLRAKYLAYVKDIATKWLDWAKIGPLAERYQAVIAAEVKADQRKLDGIEEFPADLPARTDDLRGFIDERRAYLLGYQPTIRAAR
ncbi:MAG: CotH kinase family protein [Vicinamibacterales bacterium]